MTRSFGLDAPSALEALTAAIRRFKDDELDRDLARDCAVKAWHLCDLDGNSRFGRLEVLQEHVRKSCPALAYLQDVCTESKHAEITRYRPSIDKARFHTGDFSNRDFCSDDFDTSRLEIVLPDGRKLSFATALDSAVGFWSNFLETHELV